jgi:hypothetical protein
MRSPRAWPEPKGLWTMSERLLEAFREKAEQATRVPAFELIEAAGRARRRRRHAVGGALAACVLATTGILFVTNDPPAPPQPAERRDDTSLVTPYPGNQGQSLDKGTYEFELADPSLPDVRFTLPDGWNSWIGPNRFEINRSEGVGLESDRLWYLNLLVLDVASIAQRGCSTRDLSGGSPATVVRALANAGRLRQTSAPERTVRFGRPATHLRLQEGRSGACLDSVLMFGAGGSGITYLGPGTTYDVLVLDLDGHPVVVWASWTRGTPRDEVDALLGIVDSLELVEGERS